MFVNITNEMNNLTC